MGTKIEWAQETWNPVTGCSKISDGCANCYAEKMARRLQAMGVKKYRDGFAVRCHPEELEKPLHWKKPRKIFVCSMADLFHEEVPHAFRTDVFDVMCSWRWPSKAAQRRGDENDLVDPGHIYQVLTKRPQNILPWLNWVFEVWPGDTPFNVATEVLGGWPANIHLGLTVENQRAADERIPHLLDTPAAVRWVSFEPLLDFVDLPAKSWQALDWAVIGCETGPKRRECRLEWVRYLVNRCDTYHVPVFVKKLEIDGKVSDDPADWPEWARRREYPKPRRA